MHMLTMNTSFFSQSKHSTKTNALLKVSDFFSLFEKSHLMNRKPFHTSSNMCKSRQEKKLIIRQSLSYEHTSVVRPSFLHLHFLVLANEIENNHRTMIEEKLERKKKGIHWASKSIVRIVEKEKKRKEAIDERIAECGWEKDRDSRNILNNSIESKEYVCFLC